VLKQFDDLLVKVRKTAAPNKAAALACLHPLLAAAAHPDSPRCPYSTIQAIICIAHTPVPVAPHPAFAVVLAASLPPQILIVAAVVDLVIALASGERGFGAFVEPSVIVLILVANGEGVRHAPSARRLFLCLLVMRGVR
jgi:hypothetical protein